MNNNTKVLILRGIPASGKSTWAKEQVKNGGGKWKRVNKDDLRAMIDSGEFSKKNEGMIEAFENAIISESLLKNCNIIVDDTNLNNRHIQRIKTVIACHNENFAQGTINKAEIEIKWFPITLEEAAYRNKNREAKVPDKILVDMMRQYVKAGGPDPVSKIQFDPKLPNAIVVDMDGTLASFKNGHRGPYEQEKCGEDECVEEVATLLTAMNRLGYQILIVSGRYDTYRPETTYFLDKYMIEYDQLFMRKANDNRSDVIIKEEIFNRHIKDKYNVLFALDDRPCVVRLWRKLGIFVLNVGSGVEF